MIEIVKPSPFELRAGASSTGLCHVETLLRRRARPNLP
jgi:hypothetical protein